MIHEIRAVWPDLLEEPIEWFDQGWDFLVVVMGRHWVVRRPRSPAGMFRLRREVLLLNNMPLSPVKIPRYVRSSNTMAVYPFIEGQPVSGPAPGLLLKDLAAFIGWLHDQSGPEPWVNPLHKWVRWFDAQSQRILAGDILGLMPVRDAKRVKERLAKGLSCLRASAFRPVLLHGDLVRDHVLASSEGRLTGVIDFGDWRVGDPAYDWAGIPELDELWPESGVEAEFAERIQFYRFMAPFYAIERGIKSGQTELVERQLNLVHRLLSR